MPKKKVSSAAIYCRISDDPSGKRLGVKRQQRDCEAFCEDRRWPVADVLVDNDMSAYSGRERPEYRRLTNGIEDGTYDAVVVWHPDRLHRSPLELEGFIELVERTRIQVASVTAGDYDLSTPDGRLMARIVGSVARKESEDKSRRIRRKHLELAEAGKLSGGGRRPFGYEADRMTIREDEADEIRIAAEKVIGGASLRSIVRDWTERGIASVTGAPWSPTTVKRMLTSARIAGQRSHDGQIVGDAVWAAIIDLDDSLKLRAALNQRNGTKRVTERSYLLSGLVQCERCEVPMTAAPVRRKGHRYRRYACPADRGGCGRCGIGAEPLEDLVVAAILHRLDTPRLTEARARHEANRNVTDPTDVVVELEERMSELTDMFSAGEITRPEWARARDGIDHRLEEARRALTDASSTHATVAIIDTIGNLRDEWADLDIDIRHRIVTAVIDNVVIAPTTKATNRFDPARINLRWLA